MYSSPFFIQTNKEATPTPDTPPKDAINDVYTVYTPSNRRELYERRRQLEEVIPLDRDTKELLYDYKRAFNRLYYENTQLK